ncbi:MAG: flagellar biosynthesis protein FlhB [Oscillospiraceae bacterium]|nr:flagellar biosynthesis protein FlhB [Oscillospiraceae bacterium]
MPDSSQEKTEKATPKKREDARKKGQVLKSAEINTAVMMLALFGIIAVTGSMIFLNMREMLSGYLSITVADGLSDMSAERIHSMVIGAMLNIFKLIWPILAVAVAAGLAVNFAQVGFLFAGESIKPKFSRINPLEGFKRIFSIRSIVELLKSLIKLSVVGIVLYNEYTSNLPVFETLMNHGGGQDPLFGVTSAGAQIFSMCLSLAFKACMVLVIIGLADYIYQWWEFEKNLRMTKQEIKDEYKMIEGDPMIKQAIKRKQREMSMRRMMAEIPKADVVITNPTHYAVALKYEDREMDTPVVLAKGKDLVAQNIKRKAAEHGIPMVENKPVAQALYLGCDIGDEIPRELFAAVAEILAFIYKQKERGERPRTG